MQAICLWTLPLLLMAQAGLRASSADANWTDRKEYDLVLTIRSETTPQKRLDLLDQWSKKYPNSPLREARLELYLQTYQALANPAESFRISREILAADRNSALGLYWCTVLFPELHSQTPETLSAGETAARQLLASSNTYFAPDKKPASVNAAEWQKTAAATEALADRALGWAGWQKGDLAAAEDEFTKSLGKNPQDAQVSAWLGIVLSLESGKQMPAVWHLARATSMSGGNALPDEQRRDATKMLEQIYMSHHGSLDGLDDVRKASATNAFPDPAFTIDSATTVAARRAEAELSLTNPELATWLAMRRQLEAPDGQQYFSNNLQAKLTTTLKGTVVKSIPSRGARELMVAMSDQGGPEVTLKLNSPLQIYAGPGSKITFRGTPESFSSEPFNLVLTADASDVQGVARAGR
jgi:tetratricopeptide (TPR) repeat protein